MNSNLIQPIDGNITSRKIPDAATQSVSEQNSNSKNTVTQPQNHINPNANENLGNVYIIMDSNRKFKNFKELLSEENPNGLITIINCGNVNSAENILESPEIVKPSKILLHIGVSGIYEQHLQDLAFNLRNLAEKFHRKFKCQVFLSDVTPKGGYYEGHVHAVNQELTYQPRNTHIKKVDNKNLESSHLHDDRHLQRSKVQG